MVEHRLFRVVFIGVIGLFITCYCCAEAASRKLNVSDPMPEFSVLDSQGVEFHYTRAGQAALLVVFYSPQKTQSIRAIADIDEILESIGNMPHKLTFLAVSDDPNSLDSTAIKSDEQVAVHTVKDSDFKLWGTFGVIASPTVFLAGLDGRIELIKAGHGYDFAPAIKSKLQVVMGLVSEKDVRDVRQVKTVTNDSVEGKANRHLKMANMLETRGNYDGALAQVKEAVQIDPNSIGAVLELGRLYCLVSDPNQAIDTVNKIHPTDRAHKALRAFVLGKASAQLEAYQKAEKFLLEAIDLDPRNSRIYYELGKIYQVQDDKDKAIYFYRKSLDLVMADEK